MRGTVLKASLIYIVASSVRYAGFGVSRPLRMCCVSVLTSVVVEWRARKPCCDVDKGIRGVIFVRTNLSSILKELQNSEIGLQEGGFVGVVLGLRMGTIQAVFQMLGKELF